MLFRLVSFAAVALLSAAAAHPADGQESTEVGLPVFPEFAGLGLLDDLAEGDAFDSDMDDDGDGEDEGIEARAANQCTMAKLKEIMFDWSESQSSPSFRAALITRRLTTRQSSSRHHQIRRCAQQEIAELLHLEIRPVYRRLGQAARLQLYPVVPPPRLRRQQPQGQRPVEPRHEVQDRLALQLGHVGRVRQVRRVEERGQEGDVHVLGGFVLRGCGEPQSADRFVGGGGVFSLRWRGCWSLADGCRLVISLFLGR